MSLTSLIKRIQDIMRQDQGVDGDIQRLTQLVWMIFLKVFDFKEEENELDDKYVPVIPEGYRWRDWAFPLDDDGNYDMKNAMTGDSLIAFVDNTLFPVLKGNPIDFDGRRVVLFESTEPAALLVKDVMGDAVNLMKNGYLLRKVIDVLNEVDLTEAEDNHEFSEMYESLLDKLQAMGKYGEFHTPRAITNFGVEHVAPKLGETVADWAAGTGGFLVDSVLFLRKQIQFGHNEDFYQLQKSIKGGELKPLAYRLCITNLLLHGIDLPAIRYGDSLNIKNFSEIYADDQVDVACLNPPYGGIATDADKLCFPANMRSSETADLFIALTVRKLKKNGRAIIVVPDGFLFGNDNAKTEIKKYLLKECNLHTIIRLPGSCFAPYTSIATNLLFFDKTGSTENTWFYRLDMPEGYKHFSKTKPIRREHFAPVDEWWNNRTEIKDKKENNSSTETWKARCVPVSEIVNNGYSLDYCGYPNEEKVILSPKETMDNFVAERERLDKLMDEKLAEIMKLLEVN